MKKKILYIHHGTGLGGAPLSLLYLIQGLDKTIYHPIVLFLHDSQAREIFISQGIETIGPVNLYDFPHTKIWWLHWYHIPYLFKVIRDTIKTLFIAPKIYKKIKPDIVHLNTSSLIAWGYSAYKLKIPVVWHIREPLAHGYFGIRQALVKACVSRYSSAITPISKSDAKPWINNPKTQVIYNIAPENKFNFACDFKNFLTRYNLSVNSSKILFLGGLSQEKGTLLALKILENILTKIPDTKLLIAGICKETPEKFFKKFFPGYYYRKKVFVLIKKLKNSVILLGPITNVPEAMAASNVIIFPATVGHFARPIIEAGFMKKPAVASDLPPLDELIIDKQTGYLIPPKNIKEWTDTLINILQDKSLQKNLGDSAYNFCKNNFSLEKQSKIINSLYSLVLHERKHK
jgi:glycosyltransferase involved in cell wall biosynthesis